MPKASLQDFFRKHGQQRALQAYGEFATGSAWSVPMKMDLYELSREAFAGAGGVSAATGTSGLPSTTAAPPAMDVAPFVVAGAAAGGTLIVLAGLGLARRRRPH